jgi:hypothetical protein
MQGEWLASHPGRFTPVQEPVLRFELEAGGAQSWSECLINDGNFLYMPEVNPRSLGRPAQGLNITLTTEKSDLNGCLRKRSWLTLMRCHGTCLYSLSKTFRNSKIMDLRSRFEPGK